MLPAYKAGHPPLLFLSFLFLSLFLENVCVFYFCVCHRLPQLLNLPYLGSPLTVVYSCSRSSAEMLHIQVSTPTLGSHIPQRVTPSKLRGLLSNWGVFSKQPFPVTYSPKWKWNDLCYQDRSLGRNKLLDISDFWSENNPPVHHSHLQAAMSVYTAVPFSPNPHTTM